MEGNISKRTLAKFKANRTFTGRVDAFALFEAAFRDRTAPYRILQWSGVGGVGKSAFQRQLLSQLELKRSVEVNTASRRRVGFATLNFEIGSHRLIDQALLSLRLQFRETAAVRFPTFDTAFARYVSLLNPGVDLKQRHPELFLSENELLDDLLGVGKDTLGFIQDTASLAIPGANLLYKYGTRLTGWVREWWDARGKDELRELDRLRADELLEALPTFLGMDLRSAIENQSRPRDLTLLIDTYEALWRDRGNRDPVTSARVDNWVKALTRESVGLLVVITGRDPIGWEDISLGEQSIKQYRLGPLEKGDADAFLKSVPIDDAMIRERIIEGADGLPFYLALEVDRFERERNLGQYSDANVYGGSHPIILSRFIDHLDATDEPILRLASYLNRISPVLMSALVEAFLGGRALLNWERLIRWSFLTPTADGHHSMHGLMRHALQLREIRERPTLYAEIHRWLFNHFDAGCHPASAKDVGHREEAFLAEAFGHFMNIDLHEAVAWLSAHLEPYKAAARWRMIDDLLRTANSRLSTGGGSDRTTTAILLHERGYADLETGRLAFAERLFLEALEMRSQDLGPDNEDTLTTQHELARTLFQMARFEEAERMFADCLARRGQTLGERSNAYGTTLNGLACVYHYTGRYAEAGAAFRRCLQIYGDTLGCDSFDYGIILHNLGNVHLEQGDLDSAQLRLEEAEETKRLAISTDHPGYARTLYSLGRLHLELGDVDRGRQYFRNCSEILVRTLPQNHKWIRDVTTALAAI